MADGSVLLEVIVEGKNIKLVQREVEELAGSINRASTETDKNTKSSKGNEEQQKKQTKSGRELYRNQQGVAQNTANTTKAFAKQAQGISGGLVPAYAALAANVFALTAFFGALSRAAAVEKLEEGLIATGTAAGQNLPVVADRLREISGFALATKDALEATAIATSAGFSTKQLEDLTTVARGASQALGRDMTDALNRLVRGTAKLEPEILDELGIMVRLDEAAIEYAAQLGKTVSELTRFEKQQAFLNATIDQGTKKFGDIAKEIDPNPYDQLAATFDDLVKTLLNGLNTVLLPIAKFFSNNKIALTGAVVLFGKTIATQVLPALKEVAAANAELAVSAALAAKKAGSALSKEYSSKLEQVDFNIKRLPKSFLAMIPSIKAGTASTQELNLAMRQLSGTQASITREQNKLRADQTADHTARIAELEAEKNKIKELKGELQGLKVVERARYDQTGAGANLAGASASNRALANSLNQMDKTTTVMGKFDVATRGAKRQLRVFNATMARAGKTTKGFQLGLIGVKAAYRGAAAGAKLFGAALLNAIPVIGQVIFIAGLLYDALSWLWEDSAVEKAADKLVEGFEKMASTGARLAKVDMNPDLSSAEKANAQLNAQIGLLDQLEAGITQLSAAREQDADTAISAAAETLAKTKRSLAEQEAYMKERGYSQEAMDLNSVALKAAVRAAEEDLAEAREKYAGIDKKTFDQSIQGYLAQINGSESLKNAMQNELSALEALQAGVADGTITDYDKAISQLSALITPLRSVKAAGEGVTNGFNELTKEQIKFAKAAETRFDPFISAIQSVTNSMAVLEDAGSLSILPEGEVKRAENLVKALEEAGAKIEGTTTTQQLKSAVKFLKQQNNLIVTSANAQKKANAEAKFYGELAKESITFTMLQISASREASDAAIEGKKAEQTLIKAGIAEQKRSLEEILNKELGIFATEEDRQALLRQQEEARRTLLGMQAEETSLGLEIEALERSRIDAAKETLMLAEARIASERRVLDLNNRIQASKVAQNEIDEKNARSNLEATRSQSGSGVTAEDEYNLLVAANTAKEEAEAEALRLRKVGINLEYDLLAAKAAFEQSRLEGIRDDETSSQDAINAANAQLETNAEIVRLIDEAKKGALAVADAESKSNGILRQNAETVAREKMERESIRLSIEKSKASLTLIQALNDSSLTNAIQLGILAQERTQIEEDLAVLYSQREAGAANEQAILQKQLELQDKATEQIQSQIALMEELSNKQFAFQSKVIDGLKQRSKLQSEIAELANTNPITGKPIDVAKAAQIVEQERAERIKLAQVEATMKKAMIDAEYALLDAKFKLLEAEMRKDGLSSEEEAVLAATQTVLNQTALANQIAKGNIDLEFQLLKDKVAFEREKQAMELARAAAKETPLGGLLSVLTSANAASGALTKKKEKSEVDTRLEEMFGENVTLGTEDLLKANLNELIANPEKIGAAVATALESGEAERVAAQATAVANAVGSAVTQAIATMTVQTMNVQTMNTGVSATAQTAAEQTQSPTAETAQGEATAEQPTSTTTAQTNVEVKPTTSETPVTTDSTAATQGGEEDAEAKVLSLTEKLALGRNMVRGFAEDLKQLGPEGEAYAQFIDGADNLVGGVESIMDAVNGSAEGAERATAVLAGVGSAIGAIGQMQQASSAARIAGIDQEIAAEKKRDGKSKESLAKIQALEKKKEKEKRKAFEQDKKMKMAQTVINTAASAMRAFAEMGMPGAILAIALGAAQLAMIASTSYQGGGSGTPSAGGTSGVSLGERQTSVDLAKSQSSAGELAYMRGADGVGGPEAFKATNAFMGAKYRAAGGPTAGYVVGEQGPELFIPDTPGTIVPEGQSAPQQPLNVNFSINTIDASGVEDLLVQQQGNIIGMVRSAANSYGQPFLEQVDTASFTQAAGGATKY